MATDHHTARRHLERLTRERSIQTLAEAVLPNEDDLSPRLNRSSSLAPDAIHRRWSIAGDPSSAKQTMLNEATLQDASRFERNIENFIGTIELPVGLAGPLRVNGVHASGDYYVPMATTEAALVASCTRGAHLITKAGGCAAAVLNEGVSRAPAFVFDTLADVGRFADWLTREFDSVRDVAQGTTRFGKLVDLRLSIEGATAYLQLIYEVGEAAGQNMVTLATEAACRWVCDHTPIAPRRWYVEANLSGDKKACAQSFLGVRGKKAIAEVVLPGELVRSRLHCTPAELCSYYRVSAMGGVLSGAQGIQGHYANAIAAAYLATGQDAACVAESAIGVTRIEEREGDRLYASVTLPNLIVGSVGGGIGLPSARA
ncbi:MAG: 3-hydroxy-3-methylglutaryl-CoA reductase, partial [Planctomycetota bacterium]